MRFEALFFILIFLVSTLAMASEQPQLTSEQCKDPHVTQIQYKISAAKLNAHGEGDKYRKGNGRLITSPTGESEADKLDEEARGLNKERQEALNDLGQQVNKAQDAIGEERFHKSYNEARESVRAEENFWAKSDEACTDANEDLKRLAKMCPNIQENYKTFLRQTEEKCNQIRDQRADAARRGKVMEDRLKSITDNNDASPIPDDGSVADNPEGVASNEEEELAHVDGGIDEDLGAASTDEDGLSEDTQSELGLNDISGDSKGVAGLSETQEGAMDLSQLENQNEEGEPDNPFWAPGPAPLPDRNQKREQASLVAENIDVADSSSLWDGNLTSGERVEAVITPDATSGGTYYHHSDPLTGGDGITQTGTPYNENEARTALTPLVHKETGEILNADGVIMRPKGSDKPWIYIERDDTGPFNGMPGRSWKGERRADLNHTAQNLVMSTFKGENIPIEHKQYQWEMAYVFKDPARRPVDISQYRLMTFCEALPKWKGC